MYELEKSHSLVVPMKSARQHGGARGGVDGGKRWDREECGTAKHGPDSVPAKLCHRHTPAYVGPSTAARGYLLAIRTVCGNSARTDLCGGCPVMGIPTAIQFAISRTVCAALGPRLLRHRLTSSLTVCYLELRVAGVGRSATTGRSGGSRPRPVVCLSDSIPPKTFPCLR